MPPRELMAVTGACCLVSCARIVACLLNAVVGMAPINLKLSHKGLILVGSLLLLELLFVAALSTLLSRAEQEALREAHSKEIVGKTNHVFQLLYDAGRAAADYQENNGGDEAAKRYHDSVAKIDSNMAELKHCVRDEPDYYAAVERIEKNAGIAIKLVNHIMKLAEGGSLPAAMVESQSVKPLFSRVYRDLFTDLRGFMNQQEAIIAESPVAQARARQIVKWLLLAGVALNIVFAIGLALFLVRGITRRLDLVVDNTSRLLKHQPLNAPIAGSDEIAMLDHAFHHMALTLKQVDEMKQQFVAMVSHDLKSPLTSVSGFLSLLSQGLYGTLTEQGEKRVQLAERNVSRLIAMINDLLDIEKLESGQLELTMEIIPLEPVVERSVEAVRVFAEQNKVNLVVEPIDCNVYADGDRLIQVLVNLISNAVKFSPADSAVTISARPAEEKVELRIADQGCGIPAEYRQVIFERFRQVRKTDSTKKGGTGLGLAICKAIVEQHGGAIGVESEEGKGSTFWFTLPANPSPPAEPVADNS